MFFSYFSVTLFFVQLIDKKINVCVLVCVGFYNNMSHTGCLMNIRSILPIVLEAGSQRSECLHGQMKALSGGQFSHCIFTCRRGDIALWGLFCRTVIFMSIPLLWPNHIPRASPANTITLGKKFTTHEFWGDKHSVHSSVYFTWFNEIWEGKWDYCICSIRLLKTRLFLLKIFIKLKIIPFFHRNDHEFYQNHLNYLLN